MKFLNLEIGSPEYRRAVLTLTHRREQLQEQFAKCELPKKNLAECEACLTRLQKTGQLEIERVNFFGLQHPKYYPWVAHVK